MEYNHRICVIGLGYVGLPLAIEFSKKYPTLGFDINDERINQLKNNIDVTNEVAKDRLQNSNIKLSSDNSDLSSYNTYIVTVPTPIDKSKKPDLKFLENASKLVGSNICERDLVIFESTVYPGCTLQDCIPIIEKESNLKLNKNFYCGYSPERINPGDKKNTLTKITKIVSGSNNYALKLVDALYSSILTHASTFRVSSIEVAEAAKVIENTQRDLNIAFINELSFIFEKIGIDTKEVVDAAATKWNFMPFKPGLVGGHCIGVDPYYLTYKADKDGYSPEIILAGRRLNDSMGSKIAQRVIKLMISNSIIVENSDILVLGFTFKENCPDTRNTKVIDIINELKDYKANVDVYDPWIGEFEKKSQKYQINIVNKTPLKKYDSIIVAVAHDEFYNLDFLNLCNDSTVIFDIKSFLPKIEGKQIFRL